MLKVKIFLRIFFQSLIPYSTTYSKLIKIPLTQSARYLLSLILILNTVLIIFYLPIINPSKVQSYINLVTQSLSQIKPDLQINFIEGTLSTNKNYPYFFWANKNNQTELLAVIDEYATSDKISTYRSDVLITNKEIVLKKFFSIDRPITILIPKTLSVQINQESVNKIIKTLEQVNNLYILLIVIIVLQIFWIINLGSLFLVIIYVFTSSCLGFTYYHLIRHRKIQLIKIIQIGLHSITFPLLYTYGFIFIQEILKQNYQLTVSYNHIPYCLIFAIITTIFLFVGVYEAYYESE